MCPTGWGFDPRLGDELAHLAVKTGIWPLKEALGGVVRHTFIPKRFLPVEEYLRPQLRFRHLFEPKPHTETLQTIQQRVDQYWDQVRKNEEWGPPDIMVEAQEKIEHQRKGRVGMSETCFTFEEYCDDLGPIKIVHLHEPSCGLRGIVVIDNVACGPSIGGVRMAPDVSTREVFRLARAMTLKNAAAGLPHGGGKAGIVADPRTPDKARLIRAFARAIRDLVDYIPGPDMGTDETCMGWMHDEIKRALGLPRVLGGIPLDEIGATGLRVG